MSDILAVISTGNVPETATQHMQPRLVLQPASLAAADVNTREQAVVQQNARPESPLRSSFLRLYSSPTPPFLTGLLGI